MFTQSNRESDGLGIASCFPFMQSPAWLQNAAMKAADALEKLSDDEKYRAVAVINQPGIDPVQAVAILDNISRFPKSERIKVYEDNESDESKRKAHALTRAADAGCADSVEQRNHRARQ